MHDAAFWIALCASVTVVVAGFVAHLRLRAWARGVPFRWGGAPRSWTRCSVRVGVLLYAAFLFVALLMAPNLSSAIDRSNQKRTMADLRSIGTAVEEFAIDHHAYPRLLTRHGEIDDGTRLMPWSQGAPRLVSLLENDLSPGYIKTVPTEDGWGAPIYYDSDGTNYAILALGKGGTMEPWTWSESGPGPTQRADFIFAGGQFFKY